MTTTIDKSPVARATRRSPRRLPARAQNVVAALAWMAVALASFVAIAISGRAAGQGVDTMHLMFYRSIVALILVTGMIAVSPAGLRQIATRRLALLATRNVIHFIAQFSWFYALMIIPLAQLFAVEFTAPLWVAVLAPVLLKERLTATRLLAAAIGFLGIIVIVRPGAVPVSAGTLLALVAALGFAGSMIATKRLVVTETILGFLFHMSWMQMVMAGIAILPDPHLPTLETFKWIGAVALFGVSAHFSLARAFTHSDAIIVAPMDFLRLPLIMGVGFLLYAEPVEVWVLAGAAIVIAANVINLVGERKRRP
jgi:drug/metabolite transporter (DMT)-like permease